MADLSRDEAREMRDTGRRAMEQVARVAREAAAQAGMSRTFARVSKVNADGTLQLELGSDLHPMPLYSVRMTTACAAAQPGDTVVVDTYAHVPLATGVVHTAGSADHLVPEHSQDASTIASGTLNPARLPPATTSSPGAVSVGGGLKVSGGRLSVDNGAYVRLLWSGKSQSAVTLSESCASFRAIVAAIGGYDEVVEASTLVWEPDGKTFDVASAFVVGTNDWRSLRMRLTASGKNLSIDYNLGQTARDAVDNAYLLYVVGIV